ncbi:MAG: hypothetical protein AAGD43_16315 [Pseudomonadota bacterium]
MIEPLLGNMMGAVVILNHYEFPVTRNQSDEARAVAIQNLYC